MFDNDTSQQATKQNFFVYNFLKVFAQPWATGSPFYSFYAKLS